MKTLAKENINISVLYDDIDEKITRKGQPRPSTPKSRNTSTNLRSASRTTPSDHADQADQWKKYLVATVTATPDKE